MNWSVWKIENPVLRSLLSWLIATFIAIAVLVFLVVAVPAVALGRAAIAAWQAASGYVVHTVTELLNWPWRAMWRAMSGRPKT